MSKGLFVLADILGAKWGRFVAFHIHPQGAQYVHCSALKHQAF